jgi:NADP-dependent 3-hydroxy acid dehydrogenase YdfG
VAGLDSTSTVIYTDPELWRAVFSVNVDGVINACRSVLPIIVDQRHGFSVNVASVAGLVEVVP